MNQHTQHSGSYLGRFTKGQLEPLEKDFFLKQRLFLILKYWVCSTALVGIMVSVESDYAILDIPEINFLDRYIQSLLFVFLPVTVILSCTLYLVSLGFKSKLTALCTADKTPYEPLKRELESFFQKKYGLRNSLRTTD